MIDSHSVSTSVDSIRMSKPDIVEIMPAIVTKKIREFSSLVDVPVIAGGLVREPRKKFRQHWKQVRLRCPPVKQSYGR